MEMTKERKFGRTGDGQEAHLYILKNGNGVSAEVTDYGAALVSVKVPDKDGKLRDVVLGYDEVKGYEQGGVCFGATVGRNANRIGGAAVVIDGREWKLEKNDHGNNLHSGPDYYYKRFWKTEAVSEQEITFSLHSPHKDQGYPGNLDVRVTYSLDDDNTLSIHYEAVPDQDTIINLTNHSYFNLNGHDSGSVLGHVVTVYADYFTPADEESIPTGEIRSVEGTPMDFRNGRVIGDDIDADYDPLRFAGGYDHNWVLNHKEKFDKVAEVFSPESGIRMEVYTDLPGVQLYTANYVDHEPGKCGAVYEKRSGVCLETQYFPDAVHHDNFESPICRKNEKYDSKTAYRFLTEKE